MAEARAWRRPRKPQDLPIEFRIKPGGERFSGLLSELTMAGAYIKTDHEQQLGRKIELYIQLLGQEGEQVVRAIVRWEHPHGFGVQFVQLAEKDVYALMDILSTIDKAVKREPTVGRRLART